ncbi:MAG: metal-dependent hydrolase [Desulfovibrionaceae bacterium]|nr:metal-dependent hydrolase [Desulfovibrionaceae bacterium]
MRWMTHQVGALAAAFWLQLPPIGLFAAWFGGILPDVFDQKLAGLFKNRQTGFNRVHRGFTHWPGLWLGGILASLVFLPPEAGHVTRPLCVGLTVGGLSHVVLDMLTVQGIPLLPFTRKNKFSLKLCKTGGAGEYAFLATMLVCMWLFLREDIMRSAGRVISALTGV